METHAYLFFDGKCKEAFQFYEKTLGAKIEVLMPHKGTPAQEHVGADWADKIIHGRIKIGDQVVMASDAPEGRQHKPQGFRINLVVPDSSAAEKTFKALGEGGKIDAPMEETFFAHRFGMLTDRFDIPWMVVHLKHPQ